MKFGVSPLCDIPKRTGDIVFKPNGNIIRFQAIGGDEHRTKGLEFERVFLPDVNEDVIPHKKSMKEEDVEEERRLFYVGVTRAKKYLHILSVKKLYNKDSRPSRFVEELRSRQEKRGVLHGK